MTNTPPDIHASRTPLTGRRTPGRAEPFPFALVLLLLGTLITPLCLAQAPFDEAGYRGIPYKAPTPDSAPGGITVLFADDVAALIASRPVTLLNVSPITLGPPDADGQRIWIPRRGYPMLNIPGSVWLPNIGYQSLDQATRHYLEQHLDLLTGNDTDHPLLVYCTSDCWMSWNAVRRLSLEYGYRTIYWYPMGIDGWQEDGRSLEKATPLPFAGQAAQ